MRYIVLFFVLFVLVATPARSDFKEGMSAYEQKEYTEAYKEFQVLADRGDDDAQYMMGFCMLKAMGCPKTMLRPTNGLTCLQHTIIVRQKHIGKKLQGK